MIWDDMNENNSNEAPVDEQAPRHRQQKHDKRGETMDSFLKTSGLRRRVLVVDDEIINRMLIGNMLEAEYDVVYAENGKEAVERLENTKTGFSLILLDLMMPEMNGFEVLDYAKHSEALKNIPIIVMTSDKDAEVKSIKLGAVDFITKPFHMPEVILARCERVIELSEDKNIIHSAERDPLTGLYAKDFFFEYIKQVEQYNASRQAMDAVVFTIEHFHLINEVYGREKGNDVLRTVAELLVDLFKDSAAFACHAEDDVFYIYCKHRESYDDIVDVCQQSLEEHSRSPKIFVRAGVYSEVDPEVPVETRFERAKAAYTRIRGDYTQKVAFYSSELYEKAIYHERLIADIEDAIENGDIKVYYQPKYAIRGKTPRLRSAEALVRWFHPELGMISPGDFIPLFESNGLIQKVDNYIWEQAAAQIKAWRETYGVTVPVSVNVSRIDIYDPDIESFLANLLTENDLDPSDLMIEITESAYAENADRLIEVINNLRGRGFLIEMDDFGSGYSSLNMLATIPIDVLKMDMAFIRNMESDDKSLRLVRLVIDIAKFLEVSVVAEGVETKSQLDLLKGMGCDYIQGFYFSGPVPPEKFAAFIETDLKVKQEERGKPHDN